MRKGLSLLLTTVSITAGLYSTATAQDAVRANPGKYTVVFENDRVRLLEYRDNPGDVSVEHEHPPHLVYSLSDWEREFVDAGQPPTKGKAKKGDVFWVPANKHSGKNIGTTPTHALIFELKDTSSKCDSRDLKE